MMQLLVTDLTIMGNSGQFCLAGWNFEEGRMVRPLPNGNNWSPALISRYEITTGCIIEVEPKGYHRSSFPHSTEDTRVTANVRVIDRSYRAWLDPASSPVVYPDLNRAFNGNVDLGAEWNNARKASVLENVHCPSLIGLRLNITQLEFFSDRYKDGPQKLRVYLNDGIQKYNLPVTCKVLRQYFDDGGTRIVNQNLPDKDDVHVRIGLARAFENIPCTVMLNAVHF